jgi:integrase
MGLQMRHIDWGRGTVEVGARTVVESDGHLHVNDHGKTDAATRTVPLPEPALAALQRHVNDGFAGSGPFGSVFVTEAGHTPFRSNFRRIFEKAVKDAGLDARGINMRQLRHTAASLMLAAGMDLLDVQHRLGHAKGSTTLDIYARVLARRVDEGTGRLAQAMRATSRTAA